MSQILIGLLNIKNDECNFIPESLIDFEDNKELKIHFEKLKNINLQIFIEQIKKNNYKLLDKDNIREIGIFYNLGKINNEIKMEQNKDDKEIKYLIKLFFAFDKLNYIIKEASKKLSSQQKYYLIYKEFKAYLNKCYDYDKIAEIINNNEKNKDLIKKNRELDNLRL